MLTHIHLDMHPYSHMNIHTCTLTNTWIYTSAHTCTHITWICTHVLSHTWICIQELTYAHPHIYICISTCIHTFTHRYTYMNIHIYVFLLFKYKLRKPMIQAASPLADLGYGQDSRQRPHQTLLSAHSLSTSKRPWSRMKRRIKRRGWG